MVMAAPAPAVVQVAALVIGIGLVVTGERPLVDAVVVIGLVVVTPLSLGEERQWALAGVAAAAGLALGSGVAATAATMPALVVAASSVLRALRAAGVRDLRSATARTRSLDVASSILVPVWATVGAASVVASVAEIELFGIGEPIVRLTAVHYLYAGVGALTIARRMRLERPAARLPSFAVVATATAPPIVAAGFVLGHPVPQIGGALLMTLGVWATAVALLASTRGPDSTGTRALRAIAGLTPWVPMVLAVAWAMAQHTTGVAALSIPAMARTHGVANGLGFVILGLLGTRPVPAASPAPTEMEVRA